MRTRVRPYLADTGYVYAEQPGAIAARYGFDRVARLASNENPFGPSPAALEAARAALVEAHRYPDASMTALRAALAAAHGDRPAVVGNGMDGVIETVLRVFCEAGDRVAVSTPTFSFYGLAARAQGAVVSNVPRRDDFGVDAGEFSDTCRGARVAFLCTPNNPTGTGTSVEDVRAIAESIGDCLLFLDNAYVEFSDRDYLPLLDDCENLVIGRTFSKIYGLAGLRVGYALLPEWLLPAYCRAATPFSGLSSVSAAAAVAALGDSAHVERTRAHVLEWRARLEAGSPLPCAPSEANFLMVDVAPLGSDKAVTALARAGVLARSCRSFPDLADHYLRVSVGADWENERLLSALRALLSA
ncbi:MAG: histidinol-phosphate transaminase [Methanospirillum sp.]|nr:histidinol-phosphate transaminase [Methanospirillum sp.]